MILRPVRPASPTGPPMHEAAGRVDEDLVVVVGELLGHDRADDVLDEVGRIIVSRSMPSLCWVEMSTVSSAHRLAVLVLEGDLGLAVGAQVGHRAGLAHLGQALGQAVRQVDRQRHEHVGLVAGVAEHHPLVAGALLVELVLTGRCPSGPPRSRRRPGRCRATARRWTTITPQVLPS